MKVSNKSIDLSLVKRVKAGDYQAFDLLVLKYQSRLISTAFKYVKDIQIAEDITQESLIKSFKSIKWRIAHSAKKSYFLHLRIVCLRCRKP
mgnify:CR=1 FL=1